jgi:HlyD family secretion protein
MVAAQNQFTPKMVETRSERDKLMFRVRVKVNSDWLRSRVAGLHSGIPGLAYVKLDPAVLWPAALQDVP